jgi:predicted Rossmann fold flavoprotein
MTKKVIVIGGGAAGFFAAINLAIKNPDYKITILEKTNKLLSKVKVSGGGRCNVTHHCFENSEMIKNYPRGSKELMQVFSKFNAADTIDWFKQQGIELKTEEDGRMFPVTDSSQTIIDCFLRLAKEHHIEIMMQCEVFAIKKIDNQFKLKTSQDEMTADAVICSTGGHNKSESYNIIKNLGHNIIEPIPSLFTINLPNDTIKKELQGISVQQALVTVSPFEKGVGGIENTKTKKSKLSYSGPVLITHWGLSGPAVLKLSAFAAHEFYNTHYNATILVNWIYPTNISETEKEIKEIQKAKHKALPYSLPLFNLPKRLWEYLCAKAEIDNLKPWAEISNKHIHKLCEALCNSSFKMEGKTTFKEEFVSCGGVDLKEIDFKTMQSKIVPGLFFCGEVINIDGITGGFNFQNAWSTAWICANSI